MMLRVYELFNEEVKRELEANPELALVFYAMYPPYDPDIEPLHNPSWVQVTAPRLETEVLARAKAGLEQARAWKRAAEEKVTLGHERVWLESG